jgi:hypothetical protein
VFVVVFVVLAVLLTSQGKRDERPVRERVVGRTWVQQAPDGKSEVRRRFLDDGTAIRERRTHSGRPWETDPYETTDRREGRYEFAAPDRIDVRFDDGSEERWTVSLPTGSRLHLGGTGEAGGGYVDASDVPTYAPTSAK